MNWNDLKKIKAAILGKNIPEKKKGISIGDR